MVGMNTFKRGYIWRVGNESSINVWRDPWLPNSPSRRVFTTHNGVMIGRVEELIDPATGGWDVQLLQDNFCPTDVRMITAIPLSPWAEEDSIAWHGNRNGIFSV
jgi:hypothetical protein